MGLLSSEKFFPSGFLEPAKKDRKSGHRNSLNSSFYIYSFCSEKISVCVERIWPLHAPLIRTGSDTGAPPPYYRGAPGGLSRLF